MAASYRNSIQPKRHYFLRVMLDRRSQTYYINDAWTRTRVIVGIASLKTAKDELKRLKHLPAYREVATFERADVPWSSAVVNIK